MATNTVPPCAAAAMLGERHWRVAAIALLSVRFIQGFIYWGGGSRRFIYGPEKLNPDAPTWMANEFQSAMPGALFGTDHLIAFLLHHFWLLHAREGKPRPQRRRPVARRHVITRTREAAEF